jgi:GNAT superfamily N-acetyltransferase
MVATSTLTPGYFNVPRGRIASVVTCLEMTQRPATKPGRATRRSLSLRHWPSPDLDRYRALFRRVGQDWLWFSRLVLGDRKLRAILADPAVEVHVLHDGEDEVGLLELDFRQEGECELAFFGVVKEAIGKGAGRFLMERALAIAWDEGRARPIRRFWVHSCTLDHPGAIGFYQRSGFRPYALMVEIAQDPRLTGHLPRGAAAHVPLIEG